LPFVNYLIDTDHAIIVDVEATAAIRHVEVLAAKRMIESVVERFDLCPARLRGDSANGSAEMPGWLQQKIGAQEMLDAVHPDLEVGDMVAI
jgi:hypothetical protein